MVKCDRYALSRFLAFVYFVIYCLGNVLNFIKYDWENKYLDLNIKEIKSNFTSRLSQLIFIIVVLLLFIAFNFTNTCELEELGVNFDSAANFLLNYDSGYQSKEIAVNYGEKYYDWYFQKSVVPMVDSNFNMSKSDYVIIYNDQDIINHKYF